MDYHAVHGHDISSFDLPSTHRLPTVSAAQALDDLQDGGSRHVSTGLPDLDHALTARLDTTDAGLPSSGGIHQGQVTEIWGPPGAGKTALGIQLAATALRGGDAVVWVDALYSIPSQRLADVCRSKQASSDEVNYLSRLVHYSCPSLAHLVALLCRPSESSFSHATSLIIIDSLSAAVNYTMPRTPETRTSTPHRRGPTTSARRLQALQYIISSLQKLAATRNIAVVLLTQCATKMQAEQGAALIPALHATVWDRGISTRIVLFRDWVWNGDEAVSLHFAAVQKLDDKEHLGRLEPITAFGIRAAGLVSIKYDGGRQTCTSPVKTPRQKRKIGYTGFEIPDSDEEDYGWQEDEDTMPQMPPQWQGSEDLLLGAQPSDDDNDAIANDEDDDGGGGGGGRGGSGGCEQLHDSSQLAQQANVTANGEDEATAGGSTTEAGFDDGGYEAGRLKI